MARHHCPQPETIGLSSETNRMPDETIQDTIETLAKEGFASTSFSQGSSSQSAKSIEELIAADRYLKGEKAKKRPGGGIGFRTIQPPGAIQ
jgi:hypothetical protein